VARYSAGISRRRCLKTEYLRVCRRAIKPSLSVIRLFREGAERLLIANSASLPDSTGYTNKPKPAAGRPVVIASWKICNHRHHRSTDGWCHPATWLSATRYCRKQPPQANEKNLLFTQAW